MSEKENHFSSKMVKKTVDELEKIASSRGDYVDDARLAAVWELEKRQVNIANLEGVEESIHREIQKNVERKEKLDDLPKDLPRKVKWAGYLMYASWGIGTLFLFFQGFVVTEHTGNSTTTTIDFSFLLTLGITWFCVYSLYRKKNWVRIVYTALFGISFWLTLQSSFELRLLLGSINILTVVQHGLGILIIYLMYSKDSNVWFSDIPVKQEYTSELLDTDL